MKKISCQAHNNHYSLLIISEDQAKLICEECLMDCLESNHKASVQNIIHLKKVMHITLSKALNSPGYFLSKTALQNDFQSFFEYLAKTDQHELEKQYCFLQEKINELKQQLESFSKIMKDYVDFAIENRQQLLTQIKIVIKYEEFENMVNNLEKQHDSVSPDIIQQIESLFYQYYSSISELNSNGLTKKIMTIFNKYSICPEQLQNQRLQIIVQKNEINSQYTQFCNLAIPKYQLNLESQFKESKILSSQFNSKLYSLIELNSGQKIKQAKIIYSGSRDGLRIESFWKKIAMKKQLLMIFKSTNNNTIFGGYSPCVWQANSTFVADSTLSSFLFSQSHYEIYPLKEEKKEYAIYGHPFYGPTFGWRHDLNIYGDFTTGVSNLGSTYYWDKSEEIKSDHLFGGLQPNVCECEIVEIVFL